MSVSADERARRLAAIEARLNPPTEPSPAASAEGDGSASAPRSGSGSGNATPRTPPRGLPKPWTPPSDHARRERRRELARILNRTIVRDSGYAQAAACIETLGKIATNIQTNPDPKFRTLKSDNNALRSKVLAVPGGRDFLILMGFHTETRQMVQYFVLDQSERRLYELGLAAEVLRDALPDLQARVAQTNVSKMNHKAEEAARAAAAKRLIEADREDVRERAERERRVREVRAAAAAAKASEEAAQPEQPHIHAQHSGPHHTVEAVGDDDGSEGEEEDEWEGGVPGYANGRRWGGGQRLGD